MTTGDTEYVDDQYAPLHLNHYVWRSEAECLLKAANKAAGVDQYGRRVDWRSTAEASCSHTSSNLPQDLRMAEQGGAIRQHMLKLFGATSATILSAETERTRKRLAAFASQGSFAGAKA